MVGPPFMKYKKGTVYPKIMPPQISLSKSSLEFLKRNREYTNLCLCCMSKCAKTNISLNILTNIPPFFSLFSSLYYFYYCCFFVITVRGI